MRDSWKSAEAYEYFMGRWSRLAARSFLNWLAPAHGMRWLDVGCGSGALSEAILNQCAAAQLTAVDRSDEFVARVQERLGKLVHCLVGDAAALPMERTSVDYAVSGLVLNFISEPVEALAEMKRVIAPAGIAAVYVWDYAGIMEFLNAFWDTAVALDPHASGRHERYRFPDANPDSLRGMFDEAGYRDIESAPIEIETHFGNFEDYWNPFLGGQGPAPSYLASLDESHRQKIRESLKDSLPIQPDGSISLRARAWAVKGRPNR
ncbi:putative methyltransferase, S-Adenosyl-L-methionine (SAM)-MTase protein [Candidatus Zixiibacteriota bacterium]|nr:putative methyltransferase, S-Adenosyl-L-methionine (SAM)-MTase protein [candidate division Zixibacteria bacterium]